MYSLHAQVWRSLTTQCEDPHYSRGVQVQSCCSPTRVSHIPTGRGERWCRLERSTERRDNVSSSVLSALGFGTCPLFPGAMAFLSAKSIERKEQTLGLVALGNCLQHCDHQLWAVAVFAKFWLRVGAFCRLQFCTSTRLDATLTDVFTSLTQCPSKRTRQSFIYFYTFFDTWLSWEC